MIGFGKAAPLPPSAASRCRRGAFGIRTFLGTALGLHVRLAGPASEPGPATRGARPGADATSCSVIRERSSTLAMRAAALSASSSRAMRSAARPPAPVGVGHGPLSSAARRLGCGPLTDMACSPVGAWLAVQRRSRNRAAGSVRTRCSRRHRTSIVTGADRHRWHLRRRPTDAHDCEGVQDAPVGRRWEAIEMHATSRQSCPSARVEDRSRLPGSTDTRS